MCEGKMEIQKGRTCICSICVLGSLSTLWLTDLIEIFSSEEQLNLLEMFLSLLCLGNSTEKNLDSFTGYSETLKHSV